MKTGKLMNVAIKVLEELEQITGTDQVRRDLDIDLFKEDLLDSLGSIQLLVALGEDFQIQLSPAEIDRAMWSTPRKIIADIEKRILV
jgi:D-alanine--poly(phosphoribitol) ligase subunit 2